MIATAGLILALFTGNSITRIFPQEENQSKTPAVSDQPWHPDLSEKQLQLFNLGCNGSTEHPSAPTIGMIDGARKTGKTIGVGYKWCRHLWDVPATRVALVSKTIKSANDAGVLKDLIDIVIPQWIESGIGFEFTTRDSNGVPGPKVDPKTRTIYFKVRNRYGGEGEMQLVSLNHDAEVYEVFKNTRWSGIWLSEASHFKDGKVFRTLAMQLRMYHLKPWEHLFLGDTNPAEEGEDHWFYKLAYLRKYADAGEEEDYAAQQFKRSLQRITFYLEDNPWLTPDDIMWQRSLYKDDPGEYAREVDGKWVKGHGNQGKHFSDLFTPHVHIVGADTPEEGDMIDVLPTTTTLYSGWDIGSADNHAAVALEKRLVNVDGLDISVWCALAELVSIGEKMQVREFALAFQLIMREIESKAGKRFEWIHWADDTALNVPRNSGAGFDALEVELATRGEISLQGVAKPEGSVRNRVKIVRRLFRENRLYASSRCKALIEMFKELRKGSTQKEYVAWNIHKHPFDAFSYPILIESGNELLDEHFRPTATKGVSYARI